MAPSPKYAESEEEGGDSSKKSPSSAKKKAPGADIRSFFPAARAAGLKPKQVEEVAEKVTTAKRGRHKCVPESDDEAETGVDMDAKKMRSGQEACDAAVFFSSAAVSKAPVLKEAKDQLAKDEQAEDDRFAEKRKRPHDGPSLESAVEKPEIGGERAASSSAAGLVKRRKLETPSAAEEKKEEPSPIASGPSEPKSPVASPPSSSSAASSAPDFAPSPKKTPKSRAKAASPKKASKKDVADDSSPRGLSAIDATSKLPLEGMKIVLTGVFEHLGNREEAEDFVKRHGGQLTSAVSGATHFLVTGYKLEDDRDVTEGSKHRKALDIMEGRKTDPKTGNVTVGKKGKVQIVSETEFHKAVTGRNPPGAATSDSSPSGSAAMTPNQAGGDSALVGTAQAASSKPMGTASAYFMLHDNMENDGDANDERMPTAEGKPRSAESSGKVHTPSPRAEGSAGESLWVEKYRPSSESELIGNGEVIKKLHTWLTDWKKVVIEGQAKPVPKAGGFRGGKFAEPERINARAALLSGPPGVGKTTSAHVVAKACGYTVIEFNASDERSKGVIDVLSDMSTGGMTLSKGKVMHNSVLIMDEMDGLAERGAPQALIKLVSQTKCPVICICNDRMHPKVRSIANKCYDLRFGRPPKNTVAKRLTTIGQREGLSIEANALELLCESVGNDLRQVINSMQLMHQTKDEVGYSDMKKECSGGIKDGQVMVTPFDVTKKLLTSSERDRMSYRDQVDSFFVDFDLIPLLVAENALPTMVHSKKLAHDQLEKICTIADDFSFGDLINSKMRSGNNWTLLPEIGLFCCIDPCQKAAAFLMRPDFPRWLGKNSSTNKNKRLLSEMQLYVSPHSTCTASSLLTSGYLDSVYERAVRPLIRAGDADDPQEGVEKCISFLDEYGLTRDHLVENLTSLRLQSQAVLYNLVDGKVKKSFTSTYNKTSHNIRMTPNTSKLGGSKAAQKVSQAAFAETSAPAKDGDDDEDSPEAEDDRLDKMISQKKVAAKVAKAKAKAARGAASLAKTPKAKATPKRSRKS